MKHPFRLGLAIAATCALAGWASPLTHAHAAGADSIALNGVADITADGSTLGCGDMGPDLNGEQHPSVDQVGGCGYFNFASSTCAGMSSDDSPPAGLCTVTANGSFTNVQCGTFNLAGNAAITSGPDAGRTITFSITFAGGRGVFTGTESTDNDTVAGSVQLTPNGAPADGPLDCADSFLITAAAAVSSGS